MNHACEKHKGESVSTDGGHFTIKLAGYEKMVQSPKFIVVDKRESKHRKYELIQGSEKTWGLTDISTREWFPVKTNGKSYFPDLDQFFKTSEEQPIHKAGTELSKKILSGVHEVPPSPPPLTLMSRITKLLMSEDFTDEELAYWKEWFRMGLDAIPPEREDRQRYMWMYSFAYGDN